MTSITMVLMPTTIGAAAVFAAMPRTPMLMSTMLGIPLFLFSLLLLRTSPVVPLRDLASGGDELMIELSVVKIRVFLALFWLTFIVALTVIKLNALQSIALTASVLYVVERISSRST
ncbi:hypothetical protein [Brenneria tiliae]|uniref:hypothetical protein n=1 Tax=Brenneria tiliae TaxID=2914984 RepID=UPI002014FA5D|nr:hypothetical protein [Brenneria tiliae]MCL2898717.1 hypothetical protein [Brenneria tiliae]MCL2903346.1 hypothetical protein [Brenneria tiliae]